MPIELWASTGPGGASDGGIEDANVGGIFGDEELERVFESDSGEDRRPGGERQERGAGRVAASDQEAAGRTVQALASAQPRLPRRATLFSS